jgi:hypothetical protein
MPVALHGNDEWRIQLIYAHGIVGGQFAQFGRMQGRDMAPLHMKHESTAAAAIGAKTFYEWTCRVITMPLGTMLITISRRLLP